MMTVKTLMDLNRCDNDVDLGKLYGVKGGAVSAWRTRGEVPPKIELKAREDFKAVLEKGLFSSTERQFASELMDKLPPEELRTYVLPVLLERNKVMAGAESKV